MSRNLLHTMLDMLTGAYARRDVRNAECGRAMETNIGRLFQTFTYGLDLIEGQAEKILEWDDLDKAQGSVLDRYGKNFGVERSGTDDRLYRLMIKVKVMAQLSGGDIDTVINAFSSLYEIEPEQITLTELFPAKIKVITAPNALTEEQIAMGLFYHKFIKRIIAAGVGLIIVMQTETPMPDIRLGVKPISMLGSMSSTTLPWIDFGHKFEKRVAVVPQAASLSSITMPENREIYQQTEEDKAQRAAAFKIIMDSGEYVIDPDDYPAEMTVWGPKATHSGAVINYYVNPHAKSYDAPCGLPRECVWYKCPDHPGYTHNGPCPRIPAKETEVGGLEELIAELLSISKKRRCLNGERGNPNP